MWWKFDSSRGHPVDNSQLIIYKYSMVEDKGDAIGETPGEGESLDDFLEQVSGEVDKLLQEPDNKEKDQERVKAIEDRLGRMTKDDRISKFFEAAQKHLKVDDDSLTTEIPVVVQDGKTILSLTNQGRVRMHYGHRPNSDHKEERYELSDRPKEFVLFELNPATSNEETRKYDTDDRWGNTPTRIENTDDISSYFGNALFRDTNDKSGDSFLARHLMKGRHPDFADVTSETIDQTAIKHIKGMMEIMRGGSGGSTPLPPDSSPPPHDFPPPPAARPPTGPTGRQ